MNISVAKEGIETIVEDWHEEDDGKRIEVSNNVVGHTFSGKHGGLSVCRLSKTVIVDVLPQSSFVRAYSRRMLPVFCWIGWEE
jgi:hypothetical protein